MSLLKKPSETFKVIEELIQHPNFWVVRSVGPGIHYAVKKGLDSFNCGYAIPILLKQCKSKEHHIQKGIGWAIKTIAKFHPEKIDFYKTAIKKANPSVWFRSKIATGLNLHAYAQRNRS